MIFNHQTLIFPAGCRFFVSEAFQSEREAARQTEQKRRGTGADLPPRRQRRRSSLSLWIFLEDLCPHKVVTAVGHQSYLPIVYEVSVLLMDTKQMSDSTNQNRVDCSLSAVYASGPSCFLILLLTIYCGKDGGDPKEKLLMITKQSSLSLMRWHIFSYNTKTAAQELNLWFSVSDNEMK